MWSDFDVEFIFECAAIEADGFIGSTCNNRILSPLHRIPTDHSIQLVVYPFIALRIDPRISILRLVVWRR